MIYALLAILLMTVVGVLMLNAATSNYGRFKNERTNQQAYLTVSSAAKIFTDSIVGDKVTIDVVEEYSGGKLINKTIKPANYSNENDITPKNPEEVRNYIRNYVQKYFEAQQNEDLAPKNDPIKYEIKTTIDGKELDRVFVELSMEKYDIIAKFSNCEGQPEKADEIYYVTARIPFINEKGGYDPIELAPITVEDENDPNHTIVTTTNEIVWKQGNMSIVRGKE